MIAGRIGKAKRNVSVHCDIHRMVVVAVQEGGIWCRGRVVPIVFASVGKTFRVSVGETVYSIHVAVQFVNGLARETVRHR